MSKRKPSPCNGAQDGASPPAANVGAAAAVGAMVGATKPRLPRIYFDGAKYSITNGNERQASRDALAAAHAEHDQWDPAEWKAKALAVLEPFRAGITHGGKRPKADGAQETERQAAAVGAELPRADQVVAAPRPAETATCATRRTARKTDAAAVGARSADPLHEKLRLAHPYEFVGSGAFGNVWKCSAFSSSAVGGKK